MSALAAAVVKAPRIDQYPPLRVVLSEADLLPVVRVESCACGTRIRLLAGDEIPAVVFAHNTTSAHQAWRAQLEP